MTMRNLVLGGLATALTAAIAAAQPANDNCSSATIVDPATLPFSDVVDTSTATADGPPAAMTGCNSTSATTIQNSVWYRLTIPGGASPVIVTVTFDDSADSYDMVGAVWQGADCASIADPPIACDDTPEPIVMEFVADPGQTYFIALGDWGTGAGGGITSVTIDAETAVPGACCFFDGTCADVNNRIDCASMSGSFTAGESCGSFTCPGPNDDCIDAVDVDVAMLPFTDTRDTSLATADGPPAAISGCNSTSATTIQNSVWYTLTVPMGGSDYLITATFDDSADSYDMVGAVWQGADCAAIADPPITCDDTPEPIVLQFEALAGQTYFIAIGDWGSSAGGGLTDVLIDGEPIIDGACCLPNGSCVFTGPLDCDNMGGTFNAGMDCASVSCPVLVPNDECADATIVTLNTPVAGTTTGASGTDIASCGFDERDVWYAFLPDPNTDYRVSTTGATANLSAAVYFGACPADSSETIACGDPTGNDALVDFTSDGLGSAVLIRIASDQADETDFDVTVGFPPPPPPNDDCADATSVDLNALPFSDQPDTSLATPDGPPAAMTGCNLTSATTVQNSVWYTLTVPAGGPDYAITVTFDDSIDSYDMVGAVWQGPDCASIADPPVACDDTPEPIVLQFDALAGQTYFIALGDWGTTPGGGLTDVLIEGEPIVPHGACCVGGVCSFVTEADCTAMGGSYAGDGTACDPDNASTLADPLVADNTSLSDSITVADSLMITDLQVRVNMSATWCGDVIATLQGPNGSTIDLLNRPGQVGGTGVGDSSNMDGNYLFTDSAAETIDEASLAGDSAYIIPEGDYLPATADDVHTSLITTFGGTDAMGAWTLTLSDNAAGDTTNFRGWELIFNGQPNTSGICSTPSCPCETDGDDAQVNVFDLLAYLSDWFPQNGMSGAGLSADFNNSGNVDVFDLLDFLSCWFPASAGNPCP